MRASNLGAALFGSTVALSLAACAGEAPPAGPPPVAEACSLRASCQAAAPACIGMVDNAGASRFGLRISQLQVTRPPLLTAGAVGRVVEHALTPANLACNLPGAGTFSWLLRFDTAAGTLETGGARPVAGPGDAYRFLDDVVAGRHLGPVTYALTPGADGTQSAAQGHDLAIPIYLDASAAAPIVFPLTAARFPALALSSAQSCIGRYDLAALDPANDCFATSTTPAFVNGGTVEGLLTLEDADGVLVPSAAESLCVHLSGDPATYGVANAAGVMVCRRDAAGQIVLRGDACTVAGQGCGDAFAVSADFAAASVRIDD